MTKHAVKAKKEGWKTLPKDEQWVVGFLTTKVFRTATLFGVTDIEKPVILVGYNGCIAVHVPIDPATICRPIGIVDKKGTPIYENDIVKKEFYTDYDAFANSDEFMGIVTYEDCVWEIVNYDNKGNKRTLPIFMAIRESHDAEHFIVVDNLFDREEDEKEAKKTKEPLPCPFCDKGFRTNYRGAYEHDNENCLLHCFELENAKQVELWNNREPINKIVKKLESCEDEAGCGKISVQKAVGIVKEGALNE